MIVLLPWTSHRINAGNSFKVWLWIMFLSDYYLHFCIMSLMLSICKYVYQKQSAPSSHRELVKQHWLRRCFNVSYASRQKWHIKGLWNPLLCIFSYLMVFHPTIIHNKVNIFIQTISLNIWTQIFSLQLFVVSAKME